MHHSIKILPDFFEAVWLGIKTFEVREDDRGYKAGDILILKEFIPAEDRFTGRSVPVFVSYVMSGGNFGIDSRFCVMSIKVLNEYPIKGE